MNFKVTLNLHARLIAAFIGSTILAMMLWDRSGNFDSDNPLNYKEHGDDRVLTREKRNTFARKLRQAYSSLNDVEGCCSLPPLLPSEALAACNPIFEGKTVNKRQKQKQQSQKKKNNNAPLSLINQISKRLFPQNNKKSNAARKGRQTTAAAQKITLQSVCYTDCTFSYLNLLNESALMLNDIELTMKDTINNKTINDVLDDALYTCEEPSACATPESILLDGKYCSIKPTILMNCVRKHLLESLKGKNCKRTPDCTAKMANLKRTNMLNMQN
ncbi:uncharacterized protein LOC132197564 [Neocloeon triangulifer]|uniref:uncharacterized protein LOC132197564 n=1 Tax=Neocloeon triangulifer TaxID=2078957 RepID=UPI00286F81C0|nr:uncharacterized protein LOC132197564 [Neocloeon triangulifer]